MNTLLIYTDGSHKAKWGSWAFIIVMEGKIIYEQSGRERYTNSLRMEFQAVIEALTFLQPNTEAKIFSDSRILVNAVLNPRKRPEAVADQIEIILQLSANHRLAWNWIKAHAGNPFNQRCDDLCAKARLHE